ncbi:ELOV4 protein, partial [Pseudoatta argentina]
MLKLFDLIETVVFVLRKKDHQISFLHTYHHITTFIYVWLMLSYFTHSFLIISISLNCSVHIVMYFYYFLSTFGSNMQRILLPIKKSITTLQMAHIAFIMVVSMQGFIPNCGTKMLSFNNKAMRIILNQQTPRTIVLHSVEIQVVVVQGAENVVSPRPPVRRIKRLQSRISFPEKKEQDGNSFTAENAIFVHYGNWLNVADGSVGSHIAYGNPEVASLGRRTTTFERPRSTAVVAAEFMYFLDNNFVGSSRPEGKERKGRRLDARLDAKKASSQFLPPMASSRSRHEWSSALTYPREVAAGGCALPEDLLSPENDRTRIVKLCHGVIAYANERTRGPGKRVRHMSNEGDTMRDVLRMKEP